MLDLYKLDQNAIWVLGTDNTGGIGRRYWWGQKCYPFLFQIVDRLLYILDKISHWEHDETSKYG